MSAARILFAAAFFSKLRRLTILTEHRDFLSAIRESPTDDAPRLIYADWLEERQDPRAEFIRVQCQLANENLSTVERMDLEVREQALLGTNQHIWAAPFDPVKHKPTWKRGFIHRLELTLDEFFEHSEAGLDFGPLHSLALEHRNEGNMELGKRLAQCRPLVDISEIDLSWAQLGAEGMLAFLESPHLTQLDMLALSEDTLAITQGLAETESLPELTRLIISADEPESEFGDQGMQLLADSPRLSGLKMLYLDNNNIGSAGATFLANSPYLTQLTHLHLGYGSYSLNHIGPEGMAALANSATLKNLTNLSLPYNRIGEAGLFAIANSPHLRQLESLFLVSNDISESGVIALARSPVLQSIKYLTLNVNPIGDEAALALAESEFAENLESLRLSRTEITSAGAAAMASSTAFLSLKSLELGANPIDNIDAFLTCPYAEQLTSLKLPANQRQQEILHDRFGGRFQVDPTS